MAFDNQVGPVGTTTGAGNSELTLVQIAAALLRRWRLLLILPLLMAAAAALFGLTRAETHVASATFLAEETEPAGLSALAQRFGADVGSGQAGTSPSFYAELLTSREILKETVETTFRVPVEEDSARVDATLVEYYGVEATESSPAWKIAADALASAISTSVNNSTGVVDVEVTAADPRLAEAITSRLLELLNEFNLERRQSQAREEERFVTARMQEAQEELARAEREMAAFLTRHRYFESSPELLFEHERLQRQVAARQEIYIELARSQAQARITAVRTTPVLTIIDSPEGSASPIRRGVVRLALLGLVLGGMLALFMALMLELMQRSRRENPQEHVELDRVRRQAARDALNLIRFRRGSRAE